MAVSKWTHKQPPLPAWRISPKSKEWRYSAQEVGHGLVARFQVKSTRLLYAAGDRRPDNVQEPTPAARLLNSDCCTRGRHVHPVFGLPYQVGMWTPPSNGNGPGEELMHGFARSIAPQVTDPLEVPIRRMARAVCM